MNGTLYDPIGLFCKIALVSLYDPETKIDLHNNTITIQPPSRSQAIARLFGSSSRGDMYTLLHPVKRFVELTCLGMEILVYRTSANQSIPIPKKLQSQSSSAASSPAIDHPLPYMLGVHHSANTDSDSEQSEIIEDKSKMDNSSSSHNKLVNHLYRNPILKRLLRYYLSGIRALQKTYAEDNAEAALQQAYNVINEAFELSENGGDVGRALRMLPPSCIDYSSSIIDQSQIIELWSDGALECIVKLFDAYISEPLPQNLIICRSQVDDILTKKDIEYQKLITKGSK
jgi:hypothetical protein